MTASGSTRAGRCTPGSCAARWNAATTRAGTCTRRSCPSRYAATYAFYREGLPAAAERLRNYVGQVDSGVMDEPATARALADFVVRGLDCGAVDDAEVLALTGIDRTRMEVLARRSK